MAFSLPWPIGASGGRQEEEQGGPDQGEILSVLVKGRWLSSLGPIPQLLDEDGAGLGEP